MKSYSVIITQAAYNSLSEVRYYLERVLFMPYTALNYVNSIENEIKKLEYMASAIASVQDEPWHSLGIKRILSKQFYVYYLIDESTDKVYVIGIIYSRRDQPSEIKKALSLFFKTDKEN